MENKIDANDLLNILNLLNLSIQFAMEYSKDPILFSDPKCNLIMFIIKQLTLMGIFFFPLITLIIAKGINHLPWHVISVR